MTNQCARFYAKLYSTLIQACTCPVQSQSGWQMHSIRSFSFVAFGGKMYEECWVSGLAFAVFDLCFCVCMWLHSNTLFRMGAAAVLLSNKESWRSASRAKYVLCHNVRVHTGARDEANKWVSLTYETGFRFLFFNTRGLGFFAGTVACWYVCSCCSGLFAFLNLLLACVCLLCVAGKAADTLPNNAKADVLCHQNQSIWQQQRISEKNLQTIRGSRQQCLLTGAGLYDCSIRSFHESYRTYWWQYRFKLMSTGIFLLPRRSKLSNIQTTVHV